MQITPATALEDVYRTLQPTPLETPEELQAFYQPAINETRGGDKMQRLHLRLGRAARDGVPFKACVMGHRGVGKSTELSRLIQQVKESFNPIRFSATTALDPGNFRPLDVVLLMMGTSINCHIANLKRLKPLKSRSHSHENLYFSRCPDGRSGRTYR